MMIGDQNKPHYAIPRPQFSGEKVFLKKNSTKNFCQKFQNLSKMTKIQILGKIFLSNFSLMTPFSDQIEAEESRSVVCFDLRSL